MGIIYQIFNTISQKGYVGSTINPKNRKAQHFTDLQGKAWKHLNLAKPQNVSLNNTSGCTGVYFVKNQNKWKAEIIVNKVYYGLGSYEKKEDAIKARKEAEVNLGI